MCSFFITNRNFDINIINRYIKLRGPDHTSCTVEGGITFVHNLLSISGLFTPQPFIKDNFVSIYNGEIYNQNEFGFFASDGYCIIPAYERYGDNFPSYLDGEFAIALVDFKLRKLIISTDLFATKPIYIAINNNEWGVSSYQSALTLCGFTDVYKIPANSIFTMCLDTLFLNKVGLLHLFSLDQHKDSFHDWIAAFKSSVKKRVFGVDKKIFIGLSSGYDSGAISCELNNQGVQYNAYTVTGKEDDSVLAARSSLITPPSKHVSIAPTREMVDRACVYLNHHVEELYYKTYTSYDDYNEFWLKLHDDSGSIGLSLVCERAVSDGCLIYLSGQGADEIFADYGFNGQRLTRHSNFGGLFPNDLTTIFPWPSFFGSSQESYLMKEEHVSGSFGLEARYPFLDKSVVQEFLFLVPELKNSNYKAPLANYLEYNHYPFLKNTKIGF